MTEGEAQSAGKNPFVFHPVVAEDYEAVAKRLDIDNFHGSRWLILGATGLVPAYLVDFLGWLMLERGLDIQLHLWVRSASRASRRFPWLGSCAAEWKVPDWKNPAQWDFPEVDYVVHAASPATPSACRADPSGVITCNALISQKLVDAIPQSALKSMLFLSSSEVYGETGNSNPDEDELGCVEVGSARSLYPLAKRLGESIFLDAMRQRGVPARVARLFHTYGPGLDLESDSRAFADLVGMAVRGEPIRLRGDGRARRAYCYLADTLVGLLLLMTHPRAPEVANIGNPDAILSVAQLARLIQRLSAQLEEPVCEGSVEVQSLAGNCFPNIARLSAIGWQPRTCPEEGFSRTLRFHNS